MTSFSNSRLTWSLLTHPDTHHPLIPSHLSSLHPSQHITLPLSPTHLVCIFKVTGDMLFSAPAAVDTCELGEIGLLGVEDLEAAVGGKKTRGSLG